MKLVNKDLEQKGVTTLNKSIKVDGGAMTFGENDDYPNVIETVVASSVTANATANIYAKFLTGGGFEQEGLNDMVIGKDYRGKEVRMLDLLRLSSESVSVFNGIYWHLPMNVEGKIDDITIQPFKHCRFSKIDDVGYTNSIILNKNFGAKGQKGVKFDPKASIPYPVFNNSKEVVLSQIEKAGGIDSFSGQMYFQFWDNRYLYPLSPFDPVYLDADTEQQVSLFKNRELRNGFMLRHILRVAEFETEEQEQRFVSMVEGAEGADGARVILLQDETDSETGQIKSTGAFQLDTIDSNLQDSLFEQWELSLANSIRKATGMPQLLIDYETSSLGATSGEALKQAAMIYNGMTKDDRNLMSRVFSEVMKHHSSEEIAKVTNWNIIPFSIDEQVDEVVEDKAEALRLEAQAKLKGSVGGVTAIISLQQSVSSGATTIDSAVATVQTMYGMPAEQARLMIGDPKPIEETNTENNASNV